MVAPGDNDNVTMDELRVAVVEVFEHWADSRGFNLTKSDGTYVAERTANAFKLFEQGFFAGVMYLSVGP